MQTHEIAAWAALALSIIIPLTLANILSKKHRARAEKLKLQPLLGVVQPPTKRKDKK